MADAHDDMIQMSKAEFQKLVESMATTAAETATKVAMDKAASMLEAYADHMANAQINTDSPAARSGAEAALRSVAIDLMKAAKTLRE
ncbi:hypothetical protein AB1L88_09160 [Tautonia sp. JC769]|uniref:hypothetical protein n=1 Tax=Tautonia sp. JC769 TaxID=3232135 RepID=UPI003459702A